MDSSNNNFKSFDDQNTDLPEGFGWDDMKEGVYAKMPPKKKRRVAAWWWFGAGAVLLILATFAWMYASQDSMVKPQIAEAIQPLEPTVFGQKPKTSNQTIKQTSIASESDDLEIESNNATTSERFGSNDHQEKVLTQQDFSTLKPAAINRQELERAGSSIENGRPDLMLTPNRSIGINSTSSNRTYSMTKRDKKGESKILEYSKEFSAKDETEFEKAQKLVLLDEIVLHPLVLSEVNIPSQSPRVHPPSMTAVVSKAKFLSIESVVTLPAAFNSPRNSLNATPWYGSGGSIGYQRQLIDRFSISADYTFQQVKEEFRFTNRDTILGSEVVDYNINYLDNITLDLLTTSTQSGEQQLARFRDILTYNHFNIHQLSLFAHYELPVGIRSSFDIGLGGGVQYLTGARGFRLDSDGELVDLSSDLSTFKRMSGTLDGRIRYMFQLTPKLDLTAGINYSQTLPQALSLRMNSELPNVVSGRIGVRWSF